jgi:Ca-activated chloride channel family protein
MKDLRRTLFPHALVFCLALTALLALVRAPASAQQKEPSQQQQPASTAKPASTTPAPPTMTPAAAPTPAPDRSGEVGDKPVLINTDLITLTVTVTDGYGRYVSGLNQKAFTVLDDKVPQELEFFSDEDAPVSVGVVFDLSGSMSGEKIRKARDALSHFIQTSHEQDEYFLVGFNDRAQLLLDKTRDGESVLNKLSFVEPRHNTALYDACYLGVEKVTRGSHPKRAILLISDGQDNDSRYTFSELRRLLKESDVVLYSIGILSGNDSGSSLGMGGQAILDELSSVSGGKAFFPNTSAEMDDTFEKIALELRHQYSIGYRPANFVTDGKWHRLKVKVNPPRGLPRLFVRSKEGYFAIASPK